MNDLIRVPVLDVNGRMTYVYKRADNTPSKLSQKKSRNANRKTPAPTRTGYSAYSSANSLKIDKTSVKNIFGMLGFSKTLSTRMLKSEESPLVFDGLRRLASDADRNISDFDKRNESTHIAAVAKRIDEYIRPVLDKMNQMDIPTTRQARHIFLILSTTNHLYQIPKYPVEKVDKALTDDASSLIKLKEIAGDWDFVALVKENGVDMDVLSSLMQGE